MKERERLLREIAALRDAVSRLKQFYFTLTNRSTALLQAEQVDTEWDQSVSELDQAEKALPFPKIEPTVGPAYEYDDVTLAASDWHTSRDRVLLVRDFAQAIGMFGDEERAWLAFQPLQENVDPESI